MVVAIVVLSLIPLDIDLSEGKDKWGHILMYCGPMFWFGLLYSAMGRQLQVALAFVALGIVLEFLQRETGYRSFEVADMVADGVGVLLGWGLVRTPLRRIFPAMERHDAGQRAVQDS